MQCSDTKFIQNISMRITKRDYVRFWVLYWIGS